jgi:hypothetical protein
MENIYNGITEVMQITPDDVIRCEPCNYLPNDFADTINHYISNHDYKLLHIGSQTSYDGRNLLSEIIALLGK